MEKQIAFNFTLPDQTGRVRRLSDYAGRWVLLYFYPKDMTPGCTTEAECFRDQMNYFTALDVQVLGVSMDTIKSHKKFTEKHQLNFPLLSDVSKKVAQKYGVLIEKQRFGKRYQGIQRDSFLINPEGHIVKHYSKVDPKTHSAEVLKDLESLKRRGNK